jgi:hypothetical protein
MTARIVASAALCVALATPGLAQQQNQFPTTGGWGIFTDPAAQPTPPAPPNNLAPPPPTDPSWMTAPQRSSAFPDLQYTPPPPGTVDNQQPRSFEDSRSNWAPSQLETEDPIPSETPGSGFRIPF